MTVSTKWDVMRYADKVKNSRVAPNGDLSAADANLFNYFLQASLGSITEPTTIVDQHDRVMAWHLPGILHDKRVVRQCPKLSSQCS
jgi:hypothetical protein